MLVASYHTLAKQRCWKWAARFWDVIFHLSGAGSWGEITKHFVFKNLGLVFIFLKLVKCRVESSPLCEHLSPLLHTLFKLHGQLKMCDHSLQGFGPIKKYKNFQIEGIYRSWFDIFYKIELELFLICSDEDWRSLSPP